MIVPALFVACSITRIAGGGDRAYDVVILAPRGQLNDSHRTFAASHGIVIDESMALDEIRDIVIEKGRLSGATLMKLLLPKHFATQYEKILYLDADLTIHSDVSRLFDVDLGVFPLAAIPSGRVLSDLSEDDAERANSQFAALGMTLPYRYFNSGVMLMSTSNWLEAKVGERALDFIRRNPALCRLPDEDALNAVLDGGILELSPIWNAYPGRLPETWVKPAILHYMGDNKPWKRFGRNKRPGSHREAYQLYRAFIEETPWRDFLRSQWRWKDLVGSLICEMESRMKLLTERTGSRTFDRTRFARDIQRYLEETVFADIEQGIVKRDRSILRLESHVNPPATP
jgi:lipopolysaccharide biosynthesis glycosyltransferase